MSKAPKNIEKILLGAGVVVGGTLAAFGIMKNVGVGKDFGSSITQPSDVDTSIPLASEVGSTLNSSGSKIDVPSAEVPAPNLEGGMRPVDLYVGSALYASRDNPNEPVDPVTADNIHPPIPNAWWLKYGAKLNFADSPSRDDDNDGFTNLEEFKAKTDPTNASKHPPLIAKLTYVTDESFRWVIIPGFPLEGKLSPKLEAGDPADNAPVKMKVGFSDQLESGAIFFKEGDERFVNRFKFLGIEERAVRNERLNIDQNVTFAKFEDQKDNKKGLTYEFPTNIPRAEREAQSQYDRFAVLDLRALGFEGQDFKIEERRKFALPPDADEQAYYLKEVTPEKIVVEWEEGGETHEVEISKGQMPDFDLGE
ncbi:hypothetical protein HNR46_002134 [Haloferula luteola]|uniref:Uncharacterized protein n=1 Tax=Haloferula luteola TaxID=595692 RepID=A0A840V1M9_9BACT|nr:Amuc_1099 family pilus-like system protein [Haloferula luteola]MBB5351895.1 hypothetical protein [Haloferula luteola]